ncbi:MAG: HAD hydrolase-like protein [Phycisphaerales bacterium]|nr:HAD hydrolase-like protein [Phycisphaerales bacterium]
MLILFDIDATLITTLRSGILALEDAGRELFSPTFTVEKTEFGGRLDPLIISDLLRHNDLPDTTDNRLKLRNGYRHHITRRLETPGIGKPLPGVMTLLDRLADRPDITLGLLTGNFADTGQIKLRACGINPDRFHLAIWGDQSPHDPPSRDHLPPLALLAYHRRHNTHLDPHRAIIIGDTPHDVRCALASNMRCLAVATGSYSLDSLNAAGAHRAVKDLSDTTDILAWLLDHPHP